MTLPNEELNSLKQTRKLLRRIIQSNLTTIRKDAKELRKLAGMCLRHYPWDMIIEDLWEERINK